MKRELIFKAIKAHISKGDQAKDRAEQHYISAGQHLKTLKKQHDTEGGSWTEWTELLKSECNLSTGRASELMQIADGRTSQKKIRAKDSARKKLARDKKSSSGHPEEDPPGPTTHSGHPEEPGPPTNSDSKPVPNPLVVMWGRADPETRHMFVHACWDEIVQARDQVSPAQPNGNAGANSDRWIESDTP